MKIRFGVSIHGELSGVPELPALRIAELSGSRLTEPGFRLPTALKRKEIFLCDREDRRLYRTLGEAGIGVKQDFYRLCSKRAAAAAVCGVRSVSLAPDPADLPGLRPVLGVLCGIAEKYRLPLALEVRIPGPAAEPEAFASFRRALLDPFRTMCVLYPHEPGALEAAEKFAARFRFDCDMIRVCFDAAAGNYLSETLCRRLVKLLRPAGSADPVMIFDPGPGADGTVYAELDKLAGTGAAV